jgi:hypothetical protein
MWCGRALPSLRSLTDELTCCGLSESFAATAAPAATVAALAAAAAPVAQSAATVAAATFSTAVR